MSDSSERINKPVAQGGEGEPIQEGGLSKSPKWGFFLTLVATVGLCFAVSSVPTPLYPLYIAAWQVPPSAIGDVFAVYMAAVLLTLLCLGRLSDTFGWRRVLLTALGFVLVGIVLSALAVNVSMLLVGRALTGLGNGLLTTSVTLALIESHPTHDKRIASVAMASGLTIGFGLGPLLGGGVAQAGFYPLLLSYVPVFVGIAVCAWFIWRQGRGVAPAADFVRQSLSLRPELSMPAGPKRSEFVLACVGGFGTFATGCCFFSLLPALMAEALPWKGPVVMGLAFLPMAFICLAIQTLHRNIEPFKGLGLGLTCHALAVLSMLWGLMPFGSPLAFFVGIFFLSFGQGYGFMCSATIANLSANPARRAANMSTYFLCAYVGACLPPMIVGRIADRIGLANALTGYGVVLASGLFAVVVICLRFARRQRIN